MVLHILQPWAVVLVHIKNMGLLSILRITPVLQTSTVYILVTIINTTVKLRQLTLLNNTIVLHIPNLA